jgi:hypothetical protein
MIVVPPFAGNGGLTKSKADTLMQQFLEDRKKEREAEAQLLAEKKKKGVDEAEENLKGREFYGGNFFQSMNPFKQVKETASVDGLAAQTVVSTFARQTGLTVLRKSMQVWQRDIEKAMPVEVRWEQETLGGLRLPVIKQKEATDTEVWEFAGVPECAISMRSPNGDILFFMWFTNEDDVTMNSRKDRIFGVQENVLYPVVWRREKQTVTWRVQCKYIHTYIHTYIHACMHMYVYICMYTCMHVCLAYISSWITDIETLTILISRHDT